LSSGLDWDQKRAQNRSSYEAIETNGLLGSYTVPVLVYFTVLSFRSLKKRQILVPVPCSIAMPHHLIIKIMFGKKVMLL
jgi:hypothetical protein